MLRNPKAHIAAAKNAMGNFCCRRLLSGLEACADGSKSGGTCNINTQCCAHAHICALPLFCLQLDAQRCARKLSSRTGCYGIHLRHPLVMYHSENEKCLCPRKLVRMGLDTPMRWASVSEFRVKPTAGNNKRARPTLISQTCRNATALTRANRPY